MRDRPTQSLPLRRHVRNEIQRRILSGESQPGERLAQQALVQSETTVTTSLIALYKALGGGWVIEAENKIASDQDKKDTPNLNRESGAIQ